MQVEFLDALASDGGGWAGLYIRERDAGPGIAVNEALPAEWQAWVLAHELGHHFKDHQSDLFSPFIHGSDSRSTRRWGTWSKQDPREEAANRWAATELISEPVWRQAQSRNPCDLEALASDLGLPVVAAVVRERMRRTDAPIARSALVPLTREERETVSRRITGRGGHQAFFRRIAQSLRPGGMVLTWDDFSYARERVTTAKGGWLARYRAVVAAVERRVRKVGDLMEVFEPSE